MPGFARRRVGVVPVAALILLAAVTPTGAGEESPPLWLSRATGAGEILIFAKIHRSGDGRGYVLVKEARRISVRSEVKAAAGELVRADYDMIVPLNFDFHLGAHVFINGRGEPLLAVDTTVTPPALAVSRPYREDDRIYLGTTRDTRETISMAYYRHLADSLERLIPEAAVIARRARGLPPRSRLRDAFAPTSEEESPPKPR